jgi:hypothetical protein
MSSKKPKLDTDKMAGELEDSLYFQPPPTNPQNHKTTSTHVDKPEKPHVDKYTTHLRPGTIDAIKSYAFHHKMKDYEVVQLALDHFLVKREDK